MSFLQPLLLIALPLIALPIIIHLIHQRRFQTVQWAAMAFLLAATKMSKGYAKLRQWLILAARTLAIAGLIFAVSRPLSSGWLGMAAGGRIDTTIILLDRSASMSQIGAGGRSKLESGVRRLQENLRKLESDHYVLIDSSAMVAQELDSLSSPILLFMGVQVQLLRYPRCSKSPRNFCENNNLAEPKFGFVVIIVFRIGIQEMDDGKRCEIHSVPALKRSSFIL